MSVVASVNSLAIPLASGFTLQQERPEPGGDPFLIGLVAVALQFTALWFAARRYGCS